MVETKKTPLLEEHLYTGWAWEIVSILLENILL